jgi:hypothetical protein
VLRIVLPKPLKRIAHAPERLRRIFLPAEPPATSARSSRFAAPRLNEPTLLPVTLTMMRAENSTCFALFVAYHPQAAPHESNFM